MSMKKGNWIPISREVIYKLSPTAKDGQYSEQSAYLSLREDLEKNEVKGLRDYARIWSWSPKKTFTFFEKIGYKTGQTLETIRKQSGNNQETGNYIVYTDLGDTKETLRKQSGNTQETHTINTNNNNNNKDYKRGDNGLAKTTPANIARMFFDAYASPSLRGKNYKLYSDKLGSEIDSFVNYWTEPSKSGSKQRWEMEKTWEIGRRINTWMNRKKEFHANNKQQNKEDHWKELFGKEYISDD